MSAIHWSIVLAKIDLVSLYFRLLWYHSILKGSIDQYNEIHSPLACSRWLPWFPDSSRPYVACVKRGRGETYFRSQSLSSESAVKYPHVGPTSGEERFKYSLFRENKIGQMPYPRANKDNQIPTPYPASPPPRRLYIDRCIIIDKLFIQILIIFLLRNSLVSLRYLWRNVQKKRHARAKLLFF